MKIFFLLSLFCSSLFCCAADAIFVKSPQIPILINREDNVLYYIRVDAQDKQEFNGLTLRFGDDVNLQEIKSIKLYYSGTENIERGKEVFYSPVQYLHRDIPGKNRKADLSYSILNAESTVDNAEIAFNTDQKLFPGINYFWIGIEMKPDASIHSVIKSYVSGIVLDRKQVAFDGTNMNTHRLGVGVRYAGDDNAAAYRIPGLVTSNEGTLLGVYDVRYNSSVDLQEYIDVGLSRSTDGGQSWEDMRIIMNFGEFGGLPKAQNGVGDPAILVDKKTGAIWVIAAWTHGMGNGRAWFNSQQGLNKEQTAQLVLVKSEDDGKTWSEPVNITSQLKAPSWYFLLQGPGNGITMEDGTLVFACQFIDADRMPHAGIIYSKDRGETWHFNHPARSNTTESQVVEIEPGVLMLNMRDNRGGSRAVSVTRDMGETWQEHASSRSALIEPVCMASLIRVKADENILNRDILFFSNPNSTQNRNNITIKASLDGGLTWNEHNQLLIDENHSWGYSCLTLIDKETIGILYEGSTAHMVFQAIKITDIIKDK